MNALFGASGLLKDESIEFLSTVGPIDSRARLSQVLAAQWKWEERYGDELFDLLNEMDIPPLKVIPRRQRGGKRALGEEDEQEGTEVLQKRVRAETSTLEAVNAGVFHTFQSQFRLDIDPNTYDGPCTQTSPTYNYHINSLLFNADDQLNVDK